MRKKLRLMWFFVVFRVLWDGSEYTVRTYERTSARLSKNMVYSIRISF